MKHILLAIAAISITATSATAYDIPDSGRSKESYSKQYHGAWDWASSKLGGFNTYGVGNKNDRWLLIDTFASNFADEVVFKGNNWNTTFDAIKSKIGGVGARFSTGDNGADEVLRDELRTTLKEYQSRNGNGNNAYLNAVDQSKK